MNQKKCPKCGEMNPAEAVMCWACYTPLSSAGPGGAAVATAGAAPTALASGVVTHDEENEKKAIPPWQIAVLVIALLLAIGFGVMQLMGSSGGGTPVDTTIIPLVDPQVTQPVPQNQPPVASGPTGPSVSPNTSPNISVPAPYTMVVPPNPSIDWGVAAIVPTNQSVRGARAAQLANFAREQFRGTRNRAFQIYVFADAQSAQIFSDYQTKRRGAPLTTSDYLALSQIWPKCLARVEYNGGKETVSYPSNSPTGWWNQN